MTSLNLFSTARGISSDEDDINQTTKKLGIFSNLMRMYPVEEESDQETKNENILEKFVRKCSTDEISADSIFNKLCASVNLMSAEKNCSANPSSPNISSMMVSGKAQRKAQAVIDDNVQFRKLKEEIRASGMKTNAGVQQVLPDLIDERLVEMSQRKLLRQASSKKGWTLSRVATAIIGIHKSVHDAREKPLSVGEAMWNKDDKPRKAEVLCGRRSSHFAGANVNGLARPPVALKRVGYVPASA